MSAFTGIWIIVSFSICRSVSLYFYAINSSMRSHNLVNATIISSSWHFSRATVILSTASSLPFFVIISIPIRSYKFFRTTLLYYSSKIFLLKYFFIYNVLNSCAVTSTGIYFFTDILHYKASYIPR